MNASYIIIRRRAKMKKISKMLRFVFVLHLLVGGFCGFSEAIGAEIMLRYAGDLPVGNHLTRGQDFFAERVKEISKGRIEIQVFPAGTLFTDKDYSKAVPSGAVDMAQTLMSRWSGIVPACNFTDIPLFFDNWSHAWRAYDSEVGMVMRKGMEKAGVKVLFWMQDGTMSLASKRPVKTLQDFKGLRIRVPSELGAHTIKALGGAPVFMGGGEVYLALQRGTVDAGMSSITSFVDRKYYEVTKYITEPNFAFGLYACVINLNKWNSLSPDVQKIIMAAGDKTQEWGRKEVQKSDVTALEELKKKGMNIYDLPKAEKEVWRIALKPVYDVVLQKCGDAGPKMFESANKARNAR
jgi:tripartite ATP-independent transporter DctP family solute receptor